MSGIHSQLTAFLTVLSQGLTAIVFLTICAANIVYPSPEIYSEMFVVPIGALFAFSSVRANLPGAPAGFGEFGTDFLKSVLKLITIIGAKIGDSSSIDGVLFTDSPQIRRYVYDCARPNHHVELR